MTRGISKMRVFGNFEKKDQWNNRKKTEADQLENKKEDVEKAPTQFFL